MSSKQLFQPRLKYAKIDRKNYVKLFYEINWEPLFDASSPTEAWAYFKNQQQMFIDQVVPVKQNCAKPWFI